MSSPTKSAGDLDDESQQCCPICLECTMKQSDLIYCMPCTKCNYNFCTKCMEIYFLSSLDDYQEASDGSQQVKIHICCPQCRSKYPIINNNIKTIIWLRQIYTLATTILKKNGSSNSITFLEDSQLTASQLRSKHDILGNPKDTYNNVNDSHALYVQAIKTSMKPILKNVKPEPPVVYSTKSNVESAVSPTAASGKKHVTTTTTPSSSTSSSKNKMVLPKRSFDEDSDDDLNEHELEQSTTGDEDERLEQKKLEEEASKASALALAEADAIQQYELAKMKLEAKLKELDDAKNIWSKLFEVKETPVGDGASVSDSVNDVARSSSTEIKESKSADTDDAASSPSIADPTLFHMLDDCMTKDEQSFLTTLLTSGNPQNLAQASMILHGILQNTLTTHTNPGISAAEQALAMLSFNNNTGGGDTTNQRNRKIRKTRQEQLDEIEYQTQKEKTKSAFPLCQHMPGYFVIPLFTSRQQYLTLQDVNVGGSSSGGTASLIQPPNASKAMKQIFQKVYGDHLSKYNAKSRTVTTIQSVRGPAGRVGLRRGDVITHVNDIPWEGTADELYNMIYTMAANNNVSDSYFGGGSNGGGDAPHQQMSLTVNANEETAHFLQLRHRLLVMAKVDLLTKSKRKR